MKPLKSVCTHPTPSQTLHSLQHHFNCPLSKHSLELLRDQPVSQTEKFGVPIGNLSLHGLLSMMLRRVDRAWNLCRHDRGRDLGCLYHWSPHRNVLFVAVEQPHPFNPPSSRSCREVPILYRSISRDTWHTPFLQETPSVHRAPP